jgi:protein SCO1/2
MTHPGTIGRRWLPLNGLLILALSSASVPASAGPSAPVRGVPDEARFIYSPMPDIFLTDSTGSRVPLRVLWNRRPLIITMVFANCYEICPFYLRSLAAAVESVGGVGETFDVAVISFDPRDTPEAMRRVAEAHGLTSTPGWTFAVTSTDEARELAEAIGFWSEPAAGGSTLDHPAMLAAIDRGVVVRLMVGATVTTRRLREVIWELERVLVPTYPLPSEKVLFRCFGFDPASGTLALDWGLLLLVIPGLVMFLSAAIIFRPYNLDRM